MKPRRDTKTIFKYREHFITATLKTVINVTRSLAFFTLGEEHRFQTERRFALVEEEVRKGSVPANPLCKPPPPKIPFSLNIKERRGWGGEGHSVEVTDNKMEM